MVELHIHIVDVTCPYCGEQAPLTHTREIYNGLDFGWAYLCKPCDAYVGCHKDTTVPKGTLANAELRELRKEAHKAFDPLWHKHIMTRRDTYKWLREEMSLKRRECHIARFDLEQCRQAIALCEARKEVVD